MCNYNITTQDSQIGRFLNKEAHNFESYIEPSEPLLRTNETTKGESIVVLWISAKPLTLAVCRTWLMQKVDAFGVSLDMQWGIYSLYESVPRKCALLLGGGIRGYSMIGVK